MDFLSCNKIGYFDIHFFSVSQVKMKKKNTKNKKGDIFLENEKFLVIVTDKYHCMLNFPSKGQLSEVWEAWLRSPCVTL